MNLVKIKHLDNYEYNILFRSEKGNILMNAKLYKHVNIISGDISRVTAENIESININYKYDNIGNFFNQQFQVALGNHTLTICTKEKEELTFNIISQNNLSEEDLLEYLIDF